MQKEFKPKVRLSLVNEENKSFMGIGIIWLLKRVEKYNSLKKASEDMNMSYSKTLKIINNLEKNLGFKILEKYKGGIERGGSNLTENGKKFLKIYQNFANEIDKFVEQKFTEFLKEFNKNNF